MNEKALVSIIVPVYNSEDTLRKCVSSLISQTYKDIEIILVDDGSTDQSGTICDQFEQDDKRVKVFHTENRGVSVARNKGVSEATGEYISFVDSDDYVEDQLIEVLLNNLYEAESDLVISPLEEKLDKQDFRMNLDLRDIDKLLFLCRHYLIFGPHTKLYKSDITKTVQFPEGCSYGEDLLFNIQYLNRISTISYVNRKMYHYCRGENTLSTKVRWDMFENDMMLHGELKKWFEKKQLFTEEVQEYLSDRTFDTVFNSVCLAFRNDCPFNDKETRVYYQKILSHPLTEWSLKKADTNRYSNWLTYLIKHRQLTLLNLAAKIKRKKKG